MKTEIQNKAWIIYSNCGEKLYVGHVTSDWREALRLVEHANSLQDTCGDSEHRFNFREALLANADMLANALEALEGLCDSDATACRDRIQELLAKTELPCLHRDEKG